MHTKMTMPQRIIIQRAAKALEEEGFYQEFKEAEELLSSPEASAWWASQFLTRLKMRLGG